MSLLFGYSSSSSSDLKNIEEDLDMNENRIIDLPNPVEDDEPVTKGYADKNYSGGKDGSPGPRGERGEKGDTGPRGLRGEKGDTGSIGPRGLRGEKGDVGSQGPRGLRGPTGNVGSEGIPGNPGLVGPTGPRGLQGVQGLTGPRGKRGEKGDRGDRGEKGDPGIGFTASGFTMNGGIDMGDNKITNLETPTSNKDAATKKYVDDNTGTDPNFNSSGVTMTGEINMGDNKITNVKTPTSDKDAANKKYVDDKTGTDPNFTSSGVTMSGNIDMGDNKITNLETPTSNKDAATKKYVDDNEPKFKDDTTTTKDVDLRESSGNLEFYDEVTFKNKAKCKNLTVISTQDEIVNKNSLETGRMVGIQSLDSALRDLLTNSTKHELLVMKGKPGSSSIIYKHHTVNGNPTLTADASSVELNISFNDDLPKGIYKYVFDLHFSRSYNIKAFLYGECGGVGYNASSWYEKWNFTRKVKEEQRPILAG